MVTLEIKFKSNMKTNKLCVKNNAHDAIKEAIHDCGYAGWLRFIKEKSGDLSAKNDKYVIDIMY